MLKFIGSGDGDNEILGNNSAFIKEKDYLFLIDCGITVFDSAKKFDLLKEIKHVYVIVTHVHPDHIGSLHRLVKSNYESNIKTTIIYPLEDLKQILAKNNIAPSMYNYISPDEFDMFVIQKYETIHISGKPAFGYIIVKNNETIFYSGDTSVIQQDILSKILDEKIDIAYIDTCSLEENLCGPTLYPHLSIYTLAKIIPHDIRSKICCMHIDSYLDCEMVRNLGFKIAENEFIKKEKYEHKIEIGF